MEMFKKIVWIYDKLCSGIDKFIRGALLFIFFSIWGVYIAQIILRFLGISTAWVNEYSGFALVVATFWGGSCLIYSERHIRIKFFVNKLPEKAKKYIKILSLLFLIYYMGLFFRYGLIFAEQGIGRLTTSRTFELFYPRFISMVVGSALIIAQTINVLLKTILVDNKVHENND